MTVVTMPKKPAPETTQDRIARLRADLARAEAEALEDALGACIQAAEALAAITGGSLAVAAEASRLAAAIRSSVESIRNATKGS